jgi:hypothetical protein
VKHVVERLLRLLNAERDCPCHGVSLRISYPMTIIRMCLDSTSCRQPSCSLSARLLRSKLAAQVHTFQPLCNLSENQLAQLQSVSTAVHVLSAVLHYVSSAVFCQISYCSVFCLLWCIVSCNSSDTGHLQGICSARKCQLLCKLSSQLQSIWSVMICQLGSSL